MDEIIELINKYWTFDNNQQHTHTWHDKQDLIELLRSKQTGTNTLVMESVCDHEMVTAPGLGEYCKKCKYGLDTL